MDDLDLAIARTTKVWKFADDIKLAQEVSSIRGRQQLQTSLDNVATWARSWGMNINRAKCKVIHTGKINPGYEYTLEGVPLDSVEEDVSELIKPNTWLARKTSEKSQAVLSYLMSN